MKHADHANILIKEEVFRAALLVGLIPALQAADQSQVLPADHRIEEVEQVYDPQPDWKPPRNGLESDAVLRSTQTRPILRLSSERLDWRRCIAAWSAGLRARPAPANPAC